MKHWPTIYEDAADAILEAYRQGTRETESPMAVAYKQNQGWFVYDVTEPYLATDDQPEFLCIVGRNPLPLNDLAIDVLFSVLRKLIAKD